MSNRYVRGGAPPSSNGGSNKWTASSSSSYHHSSRGRRGRGFGRGRSFGRGGRFPNQANNKWVRPASIEEQADNDNGAAVTLLDGKSEDSTTLTADDAGSETKELSEPNTEERTTSSSDAQKPEHNLERRGRNKLVPKKNTTDSDESKVEHISDPVPTEFKDEERITSLSDVLTEEKRTLDVHKPEQNLERKGRHKLVLKKDETDPISKLRSTEDNTKYTWKRKNVEVTVSSKNNNDERIDKSKQDQVHSGPPVKQRRTETVHGPRRILLSSTATEEGKDTAVGTSEQPQKTLTDYQYQDTSARGGRGRGRGKTKAMGLVRVKTKNPSETPICPTFSRGLPCNNAKCRLRHDVSTEASRPMCVFFQRNGMCSKGDDCPFKHVKISWDAEICPTFERLGYCEDEGCVLRHVASKRSKTKR